MNIVVFCNGGGDGVVTYMLVGTQLFDVPYKKQLTKWPFKGTVTVELLNQLQDAGHERVNIKVQKIGGCGWDSLFFIPHSKLPYNAAANTCYLINDSLHFKVTVEENNCRPWLQ